MSDALVKTNIPGFVKDKQQNVLIPVGLDEKLVQVKLNRIAHKKEKAFDGIIKGLKAEISSLKARVEKLEARV